MPSICISSSCLEKQISSINPKKSPGTDLIPARVYKESASEIAPYLKIVFKQSLAEHTVPKAWKAANVTPIFKGGDREKSSNYRPISLTSISCKILEHIILRSIMGHLGSQYLLAKEQHVFRKGRSCETKLILYGSVDRSICKIYLVNLENRFSQTTWNIFYVYPRPMTWSR